MSRAALLAAAAAAAALVATAAAPARFASPLQPWRNADRTVALLRPVLARPQTTAPALGALMTPGWRLVWDGIPSAGAGEVVIRLQLPAAPVPPETGATEILQVGTSRYPDIVPRCLHDGITAKHVQRLPDRTLGGTRFLAWHDTDAGANQTIAATDYRAIVGGTCYAVERFRYATNATNATNAAPLPQPGTRFPQAAALLDAALASLRVGPAARTLPRPATFHLPPRRRRPVGKPEPPTNT